MSSSFDDPPKKLGSLAQAARGKHLKQIRGILLAIGILTIVFNGVLWATLSSRIEKELDEAGIRNPEQRKHLADEALQRNTVSFAVAIAIGVLYLVFALIVEQYPVPVTVLALVIYVAASIIFLLSAEDAGKQLGNGLIVKIFIIVCMIQAIKTAITYERERKEAREEATYDHEL